MRQDDSVTKLYNYYRGQIIMLSYNTMSLRFIFNDLKLMTRYGLVQTEVNLYNS